MFSHLTISSTADLRSALNWLRARHDGGAVSAATYHFIKQLESELAWREHERAAKVRELRKALLRDPRGVASSPLGVAIRRHH